MSVYHRYAVPTEVRQCWIPWNWNFRQLLVAMWILGIEPRFPGRAVNVQSIAETSLQPCFVLFCLDRLLVCSPTCLKT